MALILELEKAGGALWAAGDRLRVKRPPTGVSASTAEAIRRHEAELLDLLRLEMNLDGKTCSGCRWHFEDWCGHPRNRFQVEPDIVCGLYRDRD